MSKLNRLFAIILSCLIPLAVYGAVINQVNVSTCSAGTFANGIDDNGNILCGTPAVTAVSTSPPSGRLTLVSGTPVMNAAESGGTVLFTPYVGNIEPLWGGLSFVATACPEIANVLANSSTGSAGPFAAAANAVYDLFEWNNGGVCTLTRGDMWQAAAFVTNTAASPAVFSQTGHGLLNGAPVRLACTGGGALSGNFTAGVTYYAVNVTTNTYDLAATVGGSAINASTANTCGSTVAAEGIGVASLTTNTVSRGITANGLTRVNGLLTNAQAITNGPGAGFGTYVGTIVTDASGGTVTWTSGGAASGGSAAFLDIWNMYNRVTVTALVVDNGGSYTLSSAIRQARGSVNNRINFVSGFPEDGISVKYQAQPNVEPQDAQTGFIGVGINSTTAANFQAVWNSTITGTGGQFIWPVTMTADIPAQSGAGFLAALEGSQGGSGTLSMNTSPAFFNAAFRM
jgi:hypothetical protein